MLTGPRGNCRGQLALMLLLLLLLLLLDQLVMSVVICGRDGCGLNQMRGCGMISSGGGVIMVRVMPISVSSGVV